MYPIELPNFLFFSSQYLSLLASQYLSLIFVCLLVHVHWLSPSSRMQVPWGQGIRVAHHCILSAYRRPGLGRCLLNDLAWQNGPAWSGIYLSVVHSEHLIFISLFLVTAPSNSSKNQPLTQSQFTQIDLVFLPVCQEAEWEHKPEYQWISFPGYYNWFR